MVIIVIIGYSVPLLPTDKSTVSGLTQTHSLTRVRFIVIIFQWIDRRDAPKSKRYAQTMYVVSGWYRNAQIFSIKLILP